MPGYLAEVSVFPGPLCGPRSSSPISKERARLRTCKSAEKFPAGPGGKGGLEPEGEGTLQPGSVPTDTRPPVNTGEGPVMHAPAESFRPKPRVAGHWGLGTTGETHETNHEMRPGGPRSGPRSMPPLFSFQNYPWRRGKGGRERPPPGPVLVRATGGKRGPASPEPAALFTGSPPGTQGHSRFGVSTSPRWACNTL